MSSSDEEEPPPCPPELDESRGSSVSSTLRNEYEELMQFITVIPAAAAGGLTPRSGHKQPSSTPRVDARANAPHPTPLLTPNDAKKQQNVDDKENCLASENNEKSSPRTLIEDHPLNSSGNLERLSPRNALGGLANILKHDSSLSQSHQLSSAVAPNDAFIDPNYRALELNVESWCSELKHNVLDQFMNAKLGILEKQKCDIAGVSLNHQEEKEALLAEMDDLKEQIQKLQTEIRAKSDTISGMQTIIRKQSEQLDKSKHLNAWKLAASDAKREAVNGKIAESYHNYRVMCGAFRLWHRQIGERWKERVEKLCQNRAQEVCQQLELKYESTLAQLRSELEQRENEVREMQKDKEAYEENMKKAFLRGVSALNMEAQSMFQHPHVITDQSFETIVNHGGRAERGGGDHDSRGPPPPACSPMVTPRSPRTEPRKTNSLVPAKPPAPVQVSHPQPAKPSHAKHISYKEASNACNQRAQVKTRASVIIEKHQPPSTVNHSLPNPNNLASNVKLRTPRSAVN